MYVFVCLCHLFRSFSSLNGVHLPPTGGSGGAPLPKAGEDSEEMCRTKSVKVCLYGKPVGQSIIRSLPWLFLLG